MKSGVIFQQENAAKPIYEVFKPEKERHTMPIFSKLFEMLPDAEQLLNLEPEELAGPLLVSLQKEKAKNREIAARRIRVEHVIAGIKRFRIVKDKLRNYKKGFADFVMETCCGLHNFRLNFRPWVYPTPQD